MLENIKEALKSVFQSRMFVLVVVFGILLAVLIQRMFALQIVKGEEYMDTVSAEDREAADTSGNPRHDL